MRRKTGTQCTVAHPAEPWQHRLPEDPENNTALPQSLPCATKNQKEGKQLPRAPAVKRMPEPCYHGIWGVQFFPNKRASAGTTPKGMLQRRTLRITARLTSLETLPLNHRLLATLPSQAGGKKIQTKGFAPAFAEASVYHTADCLTEHLFPGVTEMASYAPLLLSPSITSISTGAKVIWLVPVLNPERQATSARSCPAPQLINRTQMLHCLLYVSQPKCLWSVSSFALDKGGKKEKN